MVRDERRYDIFKIPSVVPFMYEGTKTCAVEKTKMKITHYFTSIYV